MAKLYNAEKAETGTYRMYDGHRGSSSERKGDFIIRKENIENTLEAVANKSEYNPIDSMDTGLHFDRVTELSFRINGVELRFNNTVINDLLEKSDYLEINGLRFEKRKKGWKETLIEFVRGMNPDIEVTFATATTGKELIGLRLGMARNFYPAYDREEWGGLENYLAEIGRAVDSMEETQKTYGNV